MVKRSETDELAEKNERLGQEEALLKVIRDGMAELDRQIDLLRSEDYLDKSHLTAAREKALRERLEELRARLRETPAVAQTPTPPEGVPRTVALALEVLAGGREPQRDLRAEIKQLEAGRARVQAGYSLQQTIVNDLKGEIGATTILLKRPEWDALNLAEFRAAQVLAAAAQAKREFRQAITSAGHVWRADLLPEPTMRSSLILGSEADKNSEISWARRTLEELKIL